MRFAIPHLFQVHSLKESGDSLHGPSVPTPIPTERTYKMAAQQLPFKMSQIHNLK